MIKIVLLDFDGTIANTAPLIIKTMRETLHELGLKSCTPEQCASMIGLPLKETFTKLIPMSDEMGDRCADTYRRLFDKNNTPDATSLFPNVKETLKQLYEKGIMLTIATSRGSESLTAFLHDFGIRQYISLIMSADTVTHAKPHPEPVLTTLRQTGFKKDEALVVGDTSFDILMGKGAGVHTCGVTYGNGTKKQLMDSGAEYIINSFSSLLTIIG